MAIATLETRTCDSERFAANVIITKKSLLFHKSSMKGSAVILSSFLTNN